MKVGDQLEVLQDFIDFVEDEWILRHTDISFDDMTHTIVVTIDNVNEQDYAEIKGEENESRA